MSRLDDVRRALYRRERTTPSPPPGHPAPRREWEIPPLTSRQSHVAPAIRPPPVVPHRRLVRTAVFASVFALIALGSFIGYLALLGSHDVSLSVNGPGQITAGELTTLVLRVNNQSRVRLRSGRIEIAYPAGALSSQHPADPFQTSREEIPVDDLASGQSFERSVAVRFLAARASVEEVRATYLYRPENIESDLASEAVWRAPVARVPLAISVDAPSEVSTGQELVLAVGLDSELSSPLGNLSLGVDFPDQFKPTALDPDPADAEHHIWSVPDLIPGRSQHITIKGTIEGIPREAKPFHLRLGRYDPASRSWLTLVEYTAAPTIAAPYLYAETKLDGKRDGALHPGATLHGTVFYKNNLTEPIQNVTIAIEFPESLLELQTLEVESGFYDVPSRRIRWDATSEPRLASLDPGEEGIVSFSVGMKSDLPIRTFADTKFSVPLATTIDSASPPQSFRGVSLAYRDRVIFKVSSRLGLGARAAYHDLSAPGSGPLPPRPRRTTTYGLFLELTNDANALKSVEVRVELPGWVAWQRTVSADRVEVTFDPTQRRVVWRIGDLPAATGILRPAVRAVFQVALTPAENQINTAPLLARHIGASAEDAFSGEALEASAPDLTTELRTDAGSSESDWAVRP